MKLFFPCFFKPFMDIISNNNIAAVREFFSWNLDFARVYQDFSVTSRERANIHGLRSCP